MVRTSAAAVLNVLARRRIGVSIKLYVSHASATEIRTATMRRRGDGGSLSTMRANDRSGQCHRYRGKLIKPNHTNTRAERSVRFSHACGPAEMIRAVPTVGSSAHQPGNARAFVIRRSPTVVSAAPRRDRRLVLLGLELCGVPCLNTLK